MSEYIHPCSGCSDYEEPNGCKSKGGCGRTDCITRSSALQAVGDIHPLDYNGQGIVERIKAIPAVDAVEVVRCRDCKHYNAGFECLIEGYGIERPADWFCADGERKDGGQDK